MPERHFDVNGLFPVSFTFHSLFYLLFILWTNWNFFPLLGGKVVSYVGPAVSCFEVHVLATFLCEREK